MVFDNLSISQYEKLEFISMQKLSETGNAVLKYKMNFKATDFDVQVMGTGVNTYSVTGGMIYSFQGIKISPLVGTSV